LSKEINYALIYGGTILFSHTQVISHQFLPLSLVRWLGMLMSLTNKGKELLGISCNDLESHKEWIKAIEAHTPGVKI
jgi:1-Cys peroxiredoxin 6